MDRLSRGEVLPLVRRRWGSRPGRGAEDAFHLPDSPPRIPLSFLQISIFLTALSVEVLARLKRPVEDTTSRSDHVILQKVLGMDSRSTRRKPSYARTKSGCLTCRARRKKCDERKPICSGCARNFIHCKWPGILVLNSGPQACKPRRKDAVNDGCLDCKPPGQRDSPQSSENSPKADAFSIQEVSPTSDPRYAEAETPSHVGTENRHGEMDNPESVIVWQPLAASFISPQRATLLTSSSLVLLQHYMESTSTWLAAKPLSSNPFIAIVLPLASSDDLLMHALLALSGTHLTFRKGGHLEIQTATRAHYSLLLRNLRTIFADEALRDDVRRTSRLLLVLVVLCHVEVRRA